MSWLFSPGAAMALTPAQSPLAGRAFIWSRLIAEDCIAVSFSGLADHTESRFKPDAEHCAIG
jgi:hypothetical protein